MSITVLIIAAAHAIPVFLAKALIGRAGALIAAIIMSFIATGTGGAQYTAIDLIAIWVCFFLV